jgi:uncharacterized protein (DUF2147 family)
MFDYQILFGRCSALFRVLTMAVLFSLGFPAPGSADMAGGTPTGRWMTANGQAVIQIAPCGADLCGQIVGIVLAHPGDKMPSDWRGQPQCGLTIIQTAPGTDANGNPDWQGSVLDPRNGNVYHAEIKLDDDRHLELHGYLGLPIFGQTQTWTAYAGRTLANCKLAAATEAAGRS